MTKKAENSVAARIEAKDVEHWLHVYEQMPSQTETPSRPPRPDTRQIVVPASA